MGENKQIEVQTDTEVSFLKDEFEDVNIDELLPRMNVSAAELLPEKEECIVGDSEILELYNEILENCRQDRKSVDEILVNFIDMVMNDGDGSSASKEAIVNLVKIKSDVSDKMSKVAELKTRIKLKEKDTYPRYLAAQQNNKIVVEGSKRELIKSINQMTQRKKDGK